jgi:hypothetical protein
MSSPVDAYLAEIAAALPGPRRRRSDILAELRDGLNDAADSHRAAGLPGTAAIHAAVSEFGDPRQLAAAFRPELAVTQARRFILALSLSAPLIVLLWMHAVAASDRTGPPALSWHWLDAPPVPITTAALGVATLAALAILASRAIVKPLIYHPRLAPLSGAVAGYTVAAADLFILTLLGTQIAFAPPGSLAAVPVTAAALPTAARLGITHRAALRCIRATRDNP